MPVYRLGKALAFPPVEEAEEGLLAIGGDLSIPRLLLAYSSGIFPWFNEGDPILWHSPEERTILTRDSLHVSRRLERTLRRADYRITTDTVFGQVIAACAGTPRADQDGTWITDEMQDAYLALHEAGYAHSVEVWADDQLAGGLYGVSLGGCFFGESMFSWFTDASKIALVTLTRWGAENGITLIDCQMETAHLLSMGAYSIPRKEFIGLLHEHLRAPTQRGPWTLVKDNAIAGRGGEDPRAV
jgi:leucyl/phenylalanyl-tRNA--protein transferase